MTKTREMALVRPDLQEVFRALCRGIQPWPLFLHGEQGRGKTAAALALLDSVAAVRRGPLLEGGRETWLPNTAYYYTVGDLTELAMRQYRDLTAYDWTQISVEACQLVVLDELGTRKTVSDTHYDAVQRVLDIRENRPLILISNLDIAAIEEVYDARIASRCAGGTVFELKGCDRRIEG